MKCQNELDYLSKLVTDHIASLPPASRAAVARESQACLKNIGAALAEVPDTATPAAPAPTP
jgi:hypothetical protein